jgi:hypothetical protein
MEPYVYESFAGDVNSTSLPTQIRVLHLLPGAQEDAIRCSLLHVAVNQRFPYEALSYTWGSPDRCYEVECNGFYLRVTSTLQEALRTMRYPDKKRTLWIDQLCINQEDIQERNSQVTIMHLVYKHATRTVVFLSSARESEQTKPALSTWRLFSELRKASDAGVGNTMKECQELFTHPWFRRVWILQEISMSNTLRIIVYYNGNEMTWDKLSIAAGWFGQYAHGQRFRFFQFPPSVRQHEMIVTKWTAMDISGASSFSSLDRYGALTNKYNNWSYTRFFLWLEPRLTEVLQDSRFCLATDPHDKVYSLLNLLSSSTARADLAWLLDVDYELPVADVYSRAARYSIETEHSLEILCYKGEAPNVSNLPCWIPDWTAQSLFPMQRIANPLHYRSQFHETIWPNKSWIPPLRRTSNQSPVASFSADGKTMTLSGYKLDTIDTTSSIWDAALHMPDSTRSEEWVSLYTGGSAPEITALPFRRERWPKGVRIQPYTLGDFWLRVGRHPRLKTTDTLKPFSTDHCAQEKWRRSPYHRHRRGRAFIFHRQGNTALLWSKDWLATTLPYPSIGRRVAATRDGYFLLVPPNTAKGDVVYFFEGGGSLGYVLRRIGNAPEYEFVGAAYVHGFYGIKNCWHGIEKETVVLK